MTASEWTFDKACGYVNMDHPAIVSLLYDLDLMPEQIQSDNERAQMVLIVAHIVAVESERDEYKAQAIGGEGTTHWYWRDEAELLKGEVKALREALDKYGEHRADCNADLSEGDDVYPCTCGLDALVKEETPCS